ncbi:MAG: DUF2283 domain-containing protein [Caldilineaceae bacterium]
MENTKINYDEEADVLYISFGRSQHVTGIKLADNVLLRVDTGKSDQSAPRAIGLTFVSFNQMMARQGNTSLNIPTANLRNLPEGLSQIVWNILSSAPVSDYLAVGLSLSPQSIALPSSIAT